MKGILVKTGKYIKDIEQTARLPPTKVMETFADAIDWLIQENFTV